MEAHSSLEDIPDFGDWRVHSRERTPAKDLFNKFFIDGILFMTKSKNNMKGGIRPMYDRILLRKRAIIVTINDELKNIAQIEHSRHCSFPNFIVNLIGGIAAYCLFLKKPMINLECIYYNQFTLC